MPFIVAGIAAVVGAIGAAGAAVGGFIAATAVALGATDAIAMAIAGGVLFAATTAAVMFGLPEVSRLLFPQHSAIGGNSIAFKADPAAGVPYVIGRTGVGGNIVFADTSNDTHNTWLHYFAVLSHGPVDAIEGFTANNVPVSFNPDGTVYRVGLNFRGVWSSTTSYNVNDGVSSGGSIYICVAGPEIGHATSDTNYWAVAGAYAGPRWIDRMWQLQTVGPQPDVALGVPPGTGTVPEWTSVNKLSGLAAARWILQYDVNAFPGGSPKPLWTVRGPGVYDPRLDSTYPGGSGTQRSNDYTTWTWSQNPYLHALTWLLGRTNNGVRVLGLGAPIGAIDVPAFVGGANVADANGWKVGGQVFSTDSKWDVLTQMLASGGGFPTSKGAQISCIVDTPRVSIATVTGADFVGPVSVQSMVARQNRINQVVPTYRSEPHQWAAVQGSPINVPAYITADGTVRSKGVQMPLVQQVAQAAQLARYNIEDAREFGPITGPMLPKWLGLNPGDCITVTEPEYGMSGQLIVLLDRKIDPATGCPTITARSETTAKHAFALGQTGVAPPAPALDGANFIAAAPNAPPWAAAGATLTAGGVSIPAIVVTGTMENPNATNLIVRTRLTAGPGPWTHYDSPPAPVGTRVEITSVASGQTYDIGLSYLVKGVQGLELVIGAVTAGVFVVPAGVITGDGALALLNTVDASLASGASGGISNKNLANVDPTASATVTAGLTTTTGFVKAGLSADIGATAMFGGLSGTNLATHPEFV